MIVTVLADNRTISFAYFYRDAEYPVPLSVYHLAATPARTADEYATLLGIMASRWPHAAIKCAIVASVVPTLTAELIRALEQLYGDIPCLTVGAGLRTGLVLHTDSPAEIGADLVAMAVGAAERQAPPFLVLHCGDITTLSAVGAGKSAPEFLGCAILPGAALCAKAIGEDAAQLATVSLVSTPCAIGKNTADSMRAGVLRGHAASIDRLIADFEAEMGCPDLPVIATGEEAELMLPLLSHAAVRDAELAHKGLYRLAMRNSKKPRNGS